MEPSTSNIQSCVITYCWGLVGCLTSLTILICSLLTSCPALCQSMFFHWALSIACPTASQKFYLPSLGSLIVHRNTLLRNLAMKYLNKSAPFQVRANFEPYGHRYSEPFWFLFPSHTPSAPFLPLGESRYFCS